jgi:L-threonylcarbamoyladenylate synthase
MNIGAIKEEVRKAVEVLRNGGIILYPTDTVWGIGCDATNEKAVEKIFRIKKREESKSLIVLLEDPDKLGKYVKEIPEVANDLIEHSDKPLTIVYPGIVNLAKNVIAEDGSAGIRIVKDEFCEQLLRTFGKPVVSTSANVSGEATPAGYSSISEDIINGVDHVVNLRRTENTGTTPSRIIKLAVNGEFSIIR